MSLFPHPISKRKINVSAIKAEIKAVQKKHFHASCPITRGCPTTMAENIFRKVCGLHQAKETPSYCNQICHGDILPPGLTFADNSTIQGATMTTYVDGICQICDQHKSIKKCIDKMTCSSCDFVYRAARNSPARVLALLVELHGVEWIKEAAPIPVEIPIISDNKKIELLEKSVVAFKQDIATADMMQAGYRDDLDKKDTIIAEAASNLASLREITAGLRETIADKEEEIKFLTESLEAARDLPSPGYLTAVTGTVTSRDSALLDLAIDILAGKIQGVDVERLQALR